MGKAKTDPIARKNGESFFAWQARLAEHRAQNENEGKPIVNQETQRHGDYRSELIVDPESGKRDAVRTMVNHGHSPIMRWEAQNRLTESQKAACAYMTRQWALSCHMARLTASYGERLSGKGDESERTLEVMAASDAIQRAKSYVPRAYFDVFENVVRHGIAAGTAGEALGHASRNAKHSAYLTVCFVADVIAMKERL